MANSDTIVALFGGTGRNQVLPLTLAAVTETVLKQGVDAGTTTTPAVLTVPGSAATNGLVGSGSPVDFNQNSSISSQSYGRKYAIGSEAPYFSNATFDKGRPFRIRLFGTVAFNAGAGNSLAINIYQGTSTTVGSDFKIAAITAGGAPSTTAQFYADVLVQWDSVSQTLSGLFSGQVGNTATAGTALSTQPTVTTAAGLSFVASVVFGNAGGGVVSVSEFSITQV